MKPNLYFLNGSEYLNPLPNFKNYSIGAFRDQGQGFTVDRTFIQSNSLNLKWLAYDVHYNNKSGANVGWTWPYNSVN